MLRLSTLRHTLVAALLAMALTGCDRGMPCAPASVVRFSISGVNYRMPAEWQPLLTDQNGKSVNHQILWEFRDHYWYCQNTHLKPLDIYRWRMSENTLIALSGRYPNKFGLFDSVALLSVSKGNRSAKPEIPFEGEKYGPTLFAAQTTYSCIDFGPGRRTASCRVFGRGPNGESIVLDIFDHELTPTAWPALFRQIEAFVHEVSS